MSGRKAAFCLPMFRNRESVRLNVTTESTSQRPRVFNLGSVLQDLGDLDGARAHYERALQICRECLGEDHPHTVAVRKNLDSLDG